MYEASLVAQHKESASNAGDSCSMPGLGRSTGGEGMGPHSSILACRIPWTEEPWAIGMTKAT